MTKCSSCLTDSTWRLPEADLFDSRGRWKSSIWPVPARLENGISKLFSNRETALKIVESNKRRSKNDISMTKYPTLSTGKITTRFDFDAELPGIEGKFNGLPTTTQLKTRNEEYTATNKKVVTRSSFCKDKSAVKLPRKTSGAGSSTVRKSCVAGAAKKPPLCPVQPNNRRLQKSVSWPDSGHATGHPEDSRGSGDHHHITPLNKTRGRGPRKQHSNVVVCANPATIPRQYVVGAVPANTLSYSMFSGLTLLVQDRETRVGEPGVGGSLGQKGVEPGLKGSAGTVATSPKNVNRSPSMAQSVVNGRRTTRNSTYKEGRTAKRGPVGLEAFNEEPDEA